MVTKKENRNGRRKTRSEGKENHKKRIEATTTPRMATKAPEDTGSKIKTHCRQKTTTTKTSLRRFFPPKYKQDDAPLPIYILSVLPLGNVPAATEPSRK